MMKSLSGVLAPTQWEMVNSLVSMRFEDSKKYATSESLILFEQRILPEEVIYECCVEEVGIKLERPRMSYLSKEILDQYNDYECVPFSLDTVNNKLHIMCTYEDSRKELPTYKNYEIVRHIVPLYYYVYMRTKYYWEPSWLFPLSEKDIFTYIVDEAITLGAIDITITSRRDSGEIYYNVRKRKVYSNRSISKDDVKKLVKYIAMEAGAIFEDYDLSPKYMNNTLDNKHRGRTCIKDTIWGKAITIRVLDNEPLSKSLEDLNLTSSTIKFIRDEFMDFSENGLRLLIGPTMSGKNTTIIAMLREILLADDKKVSTVEMPVEIYLEGAEQTSVDSEDMYMLNAAALLRENPDICYLSEITNTTAGTIMVTANTAKPVYSSIHANSIPDVISRLIDLTGFSVDRVLGSLHSTIFQNLERDEETDTLRPVTKCFKFTEDIKIQLYGKTLGEIQEYFAINKINIIE